MNTENILGILIIIVVAEFIFNQALSYLNVRHQKTELPEELKGIYDEEKYKKSQEYQNTNNRFGLIASTFSFALILFLILAGGFGWLDEKIRDITQDPLLLPLLFLGILFIASDIINIPFSIYRTFVIEEKFGFNKTTVKTFILDKIKGYILAILIGGIVMGAFFFLVLDLGENFWLWFWLAAVLFMLFINMFYTSLIVPLFNKLTPLEEGELKNAIDEYSSKAGFPLSGIYIMDGSKRSAKANAFFSGLGKKKKIVLFDTLIKNHTKEELVAVLAHEVGHYKKKHILSGFFLSALHTGLMLFILSFFMFNPSLSHALGGSGLSLHLNLIAFGILYTPVSHMTGIIMNLISRKNEFEADHFAATTYNGNALSEALKKLSVNNLSNLTPHPAYVYVHYSHPPLRERLKALER